LEPIVINSQKWTAQLTESYRFPMEIIYYTGLFIIAASTVYQAYKIIKLYTKNPKRTYKEAEVVLVKKLQNAFSFLHIIFIDPHIPGDIKEKIMIHELVHVQQKHSWDIFFIQVLKMIFWFNPFIYLFEQEIKEVHEYTADKKVINYFNKEEYLDLLLQSRFRTFNVSFIHSFYKNSLIKKRIIMQNKTQSPRLNYLKYFSILILVVATSILINACDKTDEVSLENNVSTPAKNKVIIETVPNDTSKNIEVAYQFIKNPPVIEGCEGLTGEEAKACFSKTINKYITEHFNKDILKGLNIQKDRVKILTQFTIDKNGNVVNVRARSKYKVLEEEAKRTISGLPQMKPGKQKGEAVKVTYTLPIIFKVK
jgi:hypothetical protein